MDINRNYEQYRKLFDHVDTEGVNSIKYFKNYVTYIKFIDVTFVKQL
jgi:hypothetical protein